MFGKVNKKPDESASVKVYTIPTEFYGGADPVVKFKEVEKEVKIDATSNLSAADKKLFDSQTAAGGSKNLHPANLFTNKKFIIISGVLVFLLAGGGYGGYYYLQLKNNSKLAVKNTPTTTGSNFNNVSSQQNIVPTSTINEVEVVTTTIATTTNSASLVLSYPTRLFGKSADLDKDDLTDSEEEIFGTDPGVVDSDKDSYSDAHEVFYLYNPAGYKPMALIDAGKVKNYHNPTLGYQVYYPADWIAASVDDLNQEVLFSAPSGEYMEIASFDLSLGETFADWFGKNAKGEVYSELEKFTTRFNENGLRRKDGLVYYFQDNQNYVFVIFYNFGDVKSVNYRAALEVMARSFRLAGNMVEIPLQTNEESIKTVPNDFEASSTTVSSTNPR